MWTVFTTCVLLLMQLMESVSIIKTPALSDGATQLGSVAGAKGRSGSPRKHKYVNIFLVYILLFLAITYSPGIQS